MTQNTVVRARINEQIKEDATVVLESIGLTVSDAFRLMMTRIATEKAMPFEPLIPNKETVQAMQDARNGKTKSVNNVTDLMADLNEKD